MRHIATTLLLALAAFSLPASVKAGDVPDTVTRLAQVWLARHQADLPGADPIQAYSSNFFAGYTNPDSKTYAASSLAMNAYTAGQDYWRAHPDQRDSILAGYGYERVELDGTWTRAFEISGFTPRDGKGLWWVSPLAGAMPTEARGGPVRISGYLSSSGHYGHMGMYNRELLASAIVFLGPPPEVLAPRPVARTAARLRVDSCGKPVYPVNAVREQMEGSVDFALLVDKEGAVLDSKIKKSSGHRELDQAAVAAFRRCKFTPALADGEPEQGWLAMSYTFSLAPPLPVPARY